MAKKHRRQRHSYQFKYAAVMVTEHPNILAVDVAGILGKHPIMLYRWRQEMREGKMVDNDEEARSKAKLTEAEKKIRKLENELKRVRAENAVLKKAERLFPGKK